MSELVAQKLKREGLFKSYEKFTYLINNQYETFVILQQSVLLPFVPTDCFTN